MQSRRGFTSVGGRWSISEEPALCRGRIEHGLHRMFRSTHEPAQQTPVPTKLAKLHESRVGDVAERTLVAGQSSSDVHRVISGGFASLRSTAGKLRGVCDVHTVDARFETID